MAACRYYSNYFHLGIVLLSLTSLSIDVDAFSSRIRLVDRGYRDIVIGISDNVPENPKLIRNLKNIFTQVSEFMFSATNQHVYMENIRILIPESWSDDPSYESTTWESFEASDIRIDVPTDRRGDIPYVNKPTSCGQPGLYLHLTPEYVLNKKIANMYGPYHKTITHEWAHLRWGVFDEYPLHGDAKFYAASDGSIQGTRCVLAIEGNWRRMSNGKKCSVGRDGFPVETDCYFDDQDKKGGFAASLMYRQYLRGLETFCDDVSHVGPWRGGLHNAEAPNKQNKLCDGKSVWQVMREHSDFENYGKMGDTFEGTTVPTFTIVKKKDSWNVIVLDTSGSMKGSRMRLLRGAAYNLIVNVLPEGSRLGIVSFYSKADLLANLTTVNNEGKTFLLSKVPEDCGGGTSIASGVLMGLEVLKDGNHSKKARGRLLVITDGEENSSPKLEQIGVKHYEGVVIDTIAVGPTADESLENLAQRSGGQSYYHLDNSSDIFSAFNAHFAATRIGGTRNKTVELYSDFQSIPANQDFYLPFVIDESINDGLSVIIGSWRLNETRIKLRGPNRVIKSSSPEYQNVSEFDLISIKVQDEIVAGTWTLHIRNKMALPLGVTILIEAKAAKQEPPIEVTAQWAYPVITPPQQQILYVTVAQGYLPVINSVVEATVDISDSSHESPFGKTQIVLQLYDSGTGADISKDDGIYSAYFTNFLHPGRYGVTVRVKNHGNETKIMSGALVGFGAAVNPAYQMEQVVPKLHDTGNFQRQATGGSFQCLDEILCNKKETADMYPPAKITDLEATNVNFDLGELNITFTAPGDDMMEGTAAAYEIWYATDFQLLRQDYQNGTLLLQSNFSRGNTSQPSGAGEKELFSMIAMEEGSFSYAFAVVAIDDAGNRGPVSNLAASSAYDFRWNATVQEIKEIELPTLSGFIIFLLVAGCILLIVLIILVCILLITECSRRGFWAPSEKTDAEVGSNVKYSNILQEKCHKPNEENIYENAQGDQTAIYENVTLT